MNSRLPILLIIVLAAQPVRATDADYVKRLEQAAAVTYEFYDGDNNQGPTAQTRFMLDTQLKFTYKHTVRPAGSLTQLVIVPRITGFTVKVTHSIRLPKSMEPESQRHGSLLDHELDHVAISADERPLLLLKYLVSKIGVIRKTVPPGTKIDNAFVSKTVNDEIEPHRNAVIALIQANYDLLDSDDVSQSGSRPIADRKAFFSSLYTRENLERTNFPHTMQVASFLTSPSYRTAKQFYRY